MRSGLIVLLTLQITVSGLQLSGQQAEFRATQGTALSDIEKRSSELAAVNRAIWNFAEIGLQEIKSAELLVNQLEAGGFDVTTGIAGMPTAFVASYGSGSPVIAILAEYDALPGMSQQVSPERRPVVEEAAGHACGHCGLGTGAVGAALAVKAAIDEHKLKGTIRLYGTPAEETVIGKVYMTLAGHFDDVDICLHWHPKDKNVAISSSSKALISAKFSFQGIPAHASATPEAGRSALDGVELMNVGANFMREHLKEDARIHYVVVDGGGAPNVVAPKATVWYYCRADSHEDVERNFRWLQEIAEGAAKMSQTKMSVQIDTDCHELIVNAPLSTLITENLEKVGAPEYTDEEVLFARRLQQPLSTQFGMTFDEAIDRRVHRDALNSERTKGSTDVGDISWRVPTGGVGTACFVSGSPGHSWQNVAAIGSSIGEKGVIYAAQVLAVTALDLIEDPSLVAAAKADWQERMKGRTYTTLIPEGQQAPEKIR